MAPKKKKGASDAKPRPPPLAAPESPPPKAKVPKAKVEAPVQTRDLQANGDRQRHVLVTGGTGLLGRPVVQELVRRGFRVVCMSSKDVDRLHPDVQKLLADVGVTHVGLDLAMDVQNSGGKALREAVVANNIELIINLAADRGGVTWDGTKKAMNHAILNTELPGCLSAMATELGLQVLHVSTEYVWGGDDNSDGGYPATPIGEDGELRFVQDDLGAPYALQKRNSEIRVAGNPLCTVLRLPVLFGPMVNALEDGTASRCIDNFLNSNDLKHDTWQHRYPTCTLDVAFVIGALASKLFREGLQKCVYNYGAQTSLSKHGLLVLFSEAAGLRTRQVLSEDLGAFAAGKRPPFDVRLNIVETRNELEDDWREPQTVDQNTVKEVWLPFFASRVEQLNRSGASRQATFADGTGDQSPQPRSARHSSQIDLWYQVKRSPELGPVSDPDDAPFSAVVVERPLTPHHSGGDAALQMSVDVDRPSTPHHSDNASLRKDVEVDRPPTPFHGASNGLSVVDVERPPTPYHDSGGLPQLAVEIDRPLTPHHSDQGSMEPSVGVDRPDTPHHADKSMPVSERPPTPYPTSGAEDRLHDPSSLPPTAAPAANYETSSASIHDRAKPTPPPPKSAGWCSCGVSPREKGDETDDSSDRKGGGCSIS